MFKDVAKRGKSSTGWFYGFKLHLTINDSREILNFCLTPGNTDDRNEKVINQLTKNLYGKLFADKGYISQDKKMVFITVLQPVDRFSVEHIP